MVQMVVQRLALERFFHQPDVSHVVFSQKYLNLPGVFHEPFPAAKNET
jgi:hypothetical protein